MDVERNSLLNAIRTIAKDQGIAAISLEKLHANPTISTDLLTSYFKTDEELVTAILEAERKEFEVIFVDHDFEGYYDAIDILFTVSKEMASKFYKLSPSVTYEYKTLFPEIYEKHIEARINFIFWKIQVNLQKGISQGMYRDDVSIELVARRYISRLLDLHDPDNFPPEKFSFVTLFVQMFESFVESIATEKGLAYYHQKKKLADFGS